MKIQKMLVYRQNDSRGYLKKVKHLFKNNLTIIPCAVFFQPALFDGEYVHLAVIKGEDLPKEIYFNGVKKGIDLEFCGDRWCSMDGDEETDVFIFETKDEFKQARENNLIPICSNYVILEELK